MNRVVSMFKIHTRDKMLWIVTPWVFVLTSSFLVNLLIGSLLATSEGYVTGGLASIYITMLIIGAITLPQSFYFALGFTVRRTDYFAGTALMAAAVSIVYSAVLALLAIVESEWLEGWGVGLSFFHLPYWSGGSIGEQWWASVALMLHLFFLGFAIGSIYQRFKRNGLFAFFALFLLAAGGAGVLMTYYERWDDLFRFLGRYTVGELGLWSLPVTAIYALIAYMLLRRATV